MILLLDLAMTTWEIVMTFKSLYGADISTSFIFKVVNIFNRTSRKILTRPAF